MSEISVAVGSFPVQLDRTADVPLPVQLAAALREAIDAATLRPGEHVPATRELARRLGIARGVVVVAYEQLVAEGYLAATHGRGTQVNPALELTEPAGVARGEISAVSDPEPEAAARPEPLAPGLPITDSVVGPAWRSAWRDAAAHVDVVPPALGDPALRREIAEHLRRMRGTARAASDVIVTAGTRDGLGVLLTALGGTRGRELVIGVEDPGLPSLRGAAQRYGANIVALPADAEGLDTSRLPDGLLDAVIVTPSHQYPLGGSLPLPRRRELLAWARRTGVVVVEDDFDSELRYTGSALPTLAALDDPQHGSVVLLGTFSRTIAPGLAAGYLLAPAGLRARLEPLRRELGARFRVWCRRRSLAISRVVNCGGTPRECCAGMPHAGTLYRIASRGPTACVCGRWTAACTRCSSSPLRPEEIANPPCWKLPKPRGSACRALPATGSAGSRLMVWLGSCWGWAGQTTQNLSEH
ncbi:PLP-dependent aminotransferase family protein [Leucobacter luti]|uniref:aminotransferase-like domain-containing protein n=1 Tax=Leucobacter luti TaxID=340320 RepID=UPI00215D8425|nr:PLP-dependent aminotransferase family protein [Leucobacter luti]